MNIQRMMSLLNYRIGPNRIDFENQFTGPVGFGNNFLFFSSSSSSPLLRERLWISLRSKATCLQRYWRNCPHNSRFLQVPSYLRALSRMTFSPKTKGFWNFFFLYLKYFLLLPKRFHSLNTDHLFKSSSIDSDSSIFIYFYDRTWFLANRVTNFSLITSFKIA